MNSSNLGLLLKTDKRFRAWMIFFIAVIVLLFGLAYLLAYRPAFLVSWNLAIFGFPKGKAFCANSVPVCTHTESGMGLSDIVPLPDDVAQKAHGPVLDELRDLGKLPSLLAAQSDVHSSVMTTNRELTKRLACALKKHSCFGGEEVGFTLFNEINLVSKQVRYTMVNASQLFSLYSSVQSAYDEYNLTIVKALERTQLDNRKSRMITAQPLFLKLVGFDYKRMYWDPWKENERKLEEIQPGMVALEKELKRLRRIDKVTREVRGSLEVLADTLEALADTLIGKDSDITHDPDRLLWQNYASSSIGMERRPKGSNPRETWPKEWFWQHVARYVEEDEGSMADGQFDRWWTELHCWCKD